MIKHLFKLIWNKKKENILLISEILISFLVVFAVFTVVVHNYRNYKEPVGFKYENVWMADLGSPLHGENKDSLLLVFANLKNALKGMSRVVDVSLSSSNVPFSSSMMGSMVEYRHVSLQVDMYRSDQDLAKVLQMHIQAGRWFNETDRNPVYQSVVLNAAAARKLTGAVNAVGKLIRMDKQSLRVIGVADNLKDKSDFKQSTPGMYSLIDTSSVRGINTMLIRVSANADARFEDQMYRLIAGTTKAHNLEVAHLSEMRTKKNKEIIVPMVILLIISGFLIFNVALGLFGVLWYNISKRRSEIGLRRALGATAAGVSAQLLGEALVLATFSLIIGSFFALQFPLLHFYDLPTGVYLIALLLSIVFIYLLVIVCALYPGKQAAAIHPAVALHED